MKNYFKTIQKFLYGGSAQLNLDTSLNLTPDTTPDYSSLGMPDLNLNLSNTTKSNIGYLTMLEQTDPSFAAARSAARVNSIKAEDIGKDFKKVDGLPNEGSQSKKLSEKAANIMGKAADIGRGAITAVSDSLLQDKNFDAQSQAIDAAANAASEIASQFGPWGKVAGLAITALNEGTKMFGQNVQGYNVNVDNSGYAQSMMSQESKANRIWTSQREIDRQLQAKNRKLSMALHAQDISEDIKFEQTARANSIDNVIRNNQIALAGGLETAALAAKRGGKLERVLKHRSIAKAENGAKLEKIELSEEENIIPEGELHKNKHHIDLEGITQKGIPVITVDEDADTFMEIKDQEDSIVIHAEVEKEEVIFTKELTDFVEAKLKEWNESDDPKILEEVGKRITKELLFNTNDRAELIDTLR